MARTRRPSIDRRHAGGEDAPVTGARQIGEEFAGQDTELTAEQVAEVTGGKPPDEDTGLLGRIGRDDVKTGTPGDDLLGDGDPAPSDDPRERAEAGRRLAVEQELVRDDDTPRIDAPDAKEAGVFDLLDQPGEANDPLTSFLDAAEGKLGRDGGLVAPGDDAQDGTSIGKDAIAEHFHLETRQGNDFHDSTVDERGFVKTFERDGLIVRETIQHDGTTVIRELDLGKNETEYRPAEVIKPDGTHTVIRQDGSTVTTKGGEVIDETPPLEQPDPDEEGAPLPADLQAQLDSEVARFRQLRPDTGDGTTDPSEIEDEVAGAAGELPDHAEVGQALFGQPDTEAPTGGDSNANPGASSHGIGVITPADDQSVNDGGVTRNDDPFDAQEPVAEPVAAEEPPPEDAEVSLLPSEVAGPVDDGPDLPDDAFDLPD